MSCNVGTTAQTSRNKRPATTAQTTSQQNAAFDKAIKLAEEARTSGRLDEAAASYSEALRIRPKWPDGWWYLGAIRYEKDQYSEARDAFKNLVTLEPKHGPA